MGPPLVVVAEPGRSARGAGGGAIGPAVRPLTEQRLDEALGFAVGARRVGPGAQVAHPELRHAARRRASGTPSRCQSSRARCARRARKPRDGALEEAHRIAAGEASGGPRRTPCGWRRRRTRGHAPSQCRGTAGAGRHGCDGRCGRCAQGLDVDVHQLARPRALIALDRPGGSGAAAAPARAGAGPRPRSSAAAAAGRSPRP